jgi:hypothetical protein
MSDLVSSLGPSLVVAGGLLLRLLFSRVRVKGKVEISFGSNE